MRLPSPLSLRTRPALVVYQLVLILIGVIILVLVLLYIARRNQIETAPASAAGRLPSFEFVAMAMHQRQER